MKLARITAIAGLVALVAAVPVLVLRGFHPTYLVAVGIGIAALMAYLVFGKSLTEKGSNQDVSHAWLFVVLACAMGLFHIVLVNARFPASLIGIDTWTHMSRTMNTPDWSQLGASYSLMHAWLRGIIEITGFSYKWASVLFWGGLETVGIVVMVYLIGKALFSQKVGIIAALLSANATWVIQWGQWPIPNAIGAVYVLVVAYLWIRAYQTERYWLGMLSLVVLPVAFLTHLFAGAWVVGTIVVLSLPLLWKSKGNAVRIAIAVAPPCIACTGFALWYLFLQSRLAALSGLDPASGLTYALGQAPTFGTNYLSSFPELTFNSLGFFLFMGVGIIGLLLMLRQGALNRSWVLLTLGVLVIGLVPSFFGFSVIEHRWWYLAQVLMAVPLAYAIINFRNPRWTLAVSVGVIVWLNLVGLPANTMNRTFSENQIVRYALTQSEIDAYAVAESYKPEIIGADPLYTAMIRGVNHYRDYYGMVRMIDTEILTGDYSKCQADVIVLRNSLTSEPWGYGSGAIYRISDNLTATAGRFGYRTVWENDSATVMMK